MLNVDVPKLNARSHKCKERLENLTRLGFTPKVIFDVGAYLGVWSKESSELFNESHFVLIEPNTEILDKINQNITSIKDRVTVVNAAAGEKEGMAKLNVWANSKHKDQTVAFAASSLLNHVQGESSIQIETPVKTLDKVAQEIDMLPDLLKLDLQGFELPALKGADQCLKHAELCIVEFGCLDAYKERTTPNDVMNLMYQYDYVLYDIVDLIYRPYDGALVGGDFFFVKSDSRLKEHKDYF